MGIHKAIIPARVRNWLEQSFTTEQQLEIRKLMVKFIAMNGEEKMAAKMLENGFDVVGEKYGIHHFHPASMKGGENK